MMKPQANVFSFAVLTQSDWPWLVPTYLKWLANEFFTQQQINELANTLST